tara:strand:- start:4313 stop:6217 length:1905 start_codon:yes stop_codon:yes gene_type:complete
MAQAENSVTIRFKPVGHEKLITAINRLNVATKKLTNQNSEVANSSGLLNTRNKRLANTNKTLGLSFATLRSHMLLVNFAMGILGVRAITRFTKEAAKVESMGRAFKSLSGGSTNASIAMNKLEKATNGTMSQFDLFQQANNAMILGITKNSDEMAEMFDVAQRLGRALGQDTKHSVESLITGIGRQSRLMLDNIGIVVKSDDAYKEYADKIGTTVDKLSDQDKKQAFLNATMDAARSKVAALGTETLGTSDNIQIAITSMKKASKAIGDLFSPAVAGIAKMFGIAAEKVEDFVEVINFAIEGRQDFDPFETFKKSLEGLDQDALTKMITDMNSELKTLEEQQRKNDVFNKEVNKTQAAGTQAKKDDIVEIKLLTDAEAEQLKSSLKLTEGVKLVIGGYDEQVKILNEVVAEQENSTNITMDMTDKTTILTEKIKILTKALEAAKKAAGGEGESNVFWTKEMIENTKARAASIQSIGNSIAQLGAGNKKATITGLRLAQAGAIGDSIAGMAKAFKKEGVTGYLAGAAIFAQMMVQIQTINSQIREAQKMETGGLVGGRRHSQGGTIIEAEQGEFVMSRSAVEAVGIENMNRINQGGGAGITVNVSGNVMTQDFVENDLAEAIKEAARKGADFGIS